jgi:putative transposase
MEEVIESNTVSYALGLDYSESKLYVDQNGNTPPFVKAYLESLDALDDEIAFQQRKLSRMVQKSNNWIRQKRKIQKLYKHKANKRKDFLHKESRRIVNTYDFIVTEALDLKKMGTKPEYHGEASIDVTDASRAKRRRKSMFKASYSLFLTMLRYKLAEAGKTFHQVNQYFPSTQKCSRCGKQKDMPLHVRIYVCDHCGHVMDRDVNAAYNLIEEGLRLEFVRENNIEQYKWIPLPS